VGHPERAGDPPGPASLRCPGDNERRRARHRGCRAAGTGVRGHPIPRARSLEEAAAALASFTAWPVIADERVAGTENLRAGAHGIGLTVDAAVLVKALDAVVADVTDAARARISRP